MPNLRSRLLGLFFMVQVAFLLVANVLQFIPRVAEKTDEHNGIIRLEKVTQNGLPGPIQNFFELIRSGCMKYQELSGQVQYWTMFAPNFPRNIVFIRYRYTWRDGSTADFNSLYHPDNNTLPRLTDHRHRDFNYESKLTYHLGYLPPEYDAQARANVPAICKRFLKMSGSSFRQHARIRLEQWLIANPNYTLPVKVEVLLDVTQSTDPITGKKYETYCYPLFTWLPETDHWEIIEPTPESHPFLFAEPTEARQ